jgi:hypothetical protein
MLHACHGPLILGEDLMRLTLTAAGQPMICGRSRATAPAASGSVEQAIRVALGAGSHLWRGSLGSGGEQDAKGLVGQRWVALGEGAWAGEDCWSLRRRPPGPVCRSASKRQRRWTSRLELRSAMITIVVRAVDRDSLRAAHAVVGSRSRTRPEPVWPAPRERRRLRVLSGLLRAPTVGAELEAHAAADQPPGRAHSDRERPSSLVVGEGDATQLPG